MATTREYKIVIVGGTDSRISEIAVTFIYGEFKTKYDPTIEESYKKVIVVKGVPCSIDVMDTSGQEEYSSLRDQYMKTADGFVLVYSITSSSSFAQATKLRQQILRIKEPYYDFPIHLVGNRMDEEDQRVVTIEMGIDLAQRFGLGFNEASSKKNENITEIFCSLVRKINKWRERHPNYSTTPQKKTK
eukprot:TRINITY_DN481_c0_g1_i1.p1 TRINITY_DN481_c0_g1~~TRINITY_DN481_c0_g1_i1.p1  ORF type:complete len:203 (-),score=77.01 TRINITY_DN481_c0_g1_i1:63-626(-)